MPPRKNVTEQKTETTQRSPMFQIFTETDENISSDIQRLKLEQGDNYFRILSSPILVTKHWSLPESSDMIVVPCRATITDLAQFNADPKKYRENLPHCPFCAVYDRTKGFGKGNSFYDPRNSWVFNVSDLDGRNMIAEFHQRNILKEIAAIETHEDYQDLMGQHGIADVIINIRKDVGKTPLDTKYKVGVRPKLSHLTPDQYSDLMDGIFDLQGICYPSQDDDFWNDLWDQTGEPKSGEKPKKAGSSK